MTDLCCQLLQRLRFRQCTDGGTEKKANKANIYHSKHAVAGRQKKKKPVTEGREGHYISSNMTWISQYLAERAVMFGFILALAGRKPEGNE